MGSVLDLTFVSESQVGLTQSRLLESETLSDHSCIEVIAGHPRRELLENIRSTRDKMNQEGSWIMRSYQIPVLRKVEN